MEQDNFSKELEKTTLNSLVKELLPEVNSLSFNKQKLSDIFYQIKALPSNQIDQIEFFSILKRFKTFNEKLTSTLINSFIELYSIKTPDWNVLILLLDSPHKSIVQSLYDFIINSCNNKTIQIDEDVLKILSKEYLKEKSRFREELHTNYFKKIISYFKIDDTTLGNNPILYLYQKSKNLKVRLFAALLLDSDNKPLPTETAKMILGDVLFSKISNYLTYTCASYTDLIYIKPQPTGSSKIVESLRNAERVCNTDLLKELVSKLGWDRINYGLKITKLQETIIPKSLPIYIPEHEHLFLKNVLNLKSGKDIYLVKAYGGTLTEESSSTQTEGPVARFRDYNLNHATVLKDILDIAPLTKSKIDRIINLLDKVVSDYVNLFSSISEECKDLPEIYENLKSIVYSKVEDIGDQPQPSTDLTRLVQMFEEPKSVYDITTIHGLKRYLHQKGLKLGFKLVDKSQTPNRTVDLAIIIDNKITSIIKNIHYADFEPERDEIKSKSKVTYPIKIVANGFLRQMLYGNKYFPYVNIFCYGNEIHYYIYFRNHPIFIRIDYSPPLQGGMIDLEYYGISNYELNEHPNLNLDAIRKLFQKLEFDVKLDGTRIRARYDKERTIDFGLLCEKAEYLFRMLPYMMDLDWVVGTLEYNASTKDKIIEAWAESFIYWGSFPFSAMLNKEKQKILCFEEGLGESEKLIQWDGNGKYKDIFTSNTNKNFVKNVRISFNELGIELPQYSEQNILRPFGQIYLKKLFLWAFHEAVKSGEVSRSSNFFLNAHKELFVRTNPIELFAKLLKNNEQGIESSVRLAKFIIPLERTLTFHTIGKVENLNVQLTKISLLGKNLNLFILRDHHGIINLAVFSEGNGIYKNRKSISERWNFNWSFDVSEFSKILRQNNYVIPFKEPSKEDINEIILDLQKYLSKDIDYSPEIHLETERKVNGLSASPGKTTGRALLGIAKRKPEDFLDSILVAETIAPEDNTYLYHSAGIISTGGGILSHAGLIATQFEKPSIIIEGKWVTNPGGDKSIIYKQIAYKEDKKIISGLNITIMKDIHEKVHTLNDGDVVVLDANQGTLEVLGQELDTLALYDGFKTYGRTSFRITNSQESDLLSLRGKLLKARHQIEKILSRLTDPVLTKFAVHEILIGDLTSGKNADFNERTNLLKIVMENPNTQSAVNSFLNNIIMQMYQKYVSEYEEVVSNISSANYLNEIIVSRLHIIKLHNLLDKITNFLDKTNFEYNHFNLRSIAILNEISIERLRYIFENRKEETKIKLNKASSYLNLRHSHRQLYRISSLLNISENEIEFVAELKKNIHNQEIETQENLSNSYIVTSKDGGLELLPLVGGKAANLAEINQLCGEENISPWFAVSNKAFQDVMESNLDSSKSFIKEIPSAAKNVKQAIEIILDRNDLTNSQMSEYITTLWEKISLPQKLTSQIKEAYDNLLTRCNDSKNQIYFAIRSSSLEEDGEAAARAGEFETFLFIDSFESILKYLKKTWSGLWTERAIHNRKILKSDFQYKGGVIIQKIIWSRVSGVMQTINVSKNNLREIIINAGLGLGEGIVSGQVASDQITVIKEGDLENGPLNFNYLTVDKQNQIVFDENSGTGTKLVETLYHQRFRPALEYVEICELVSIGVKLEAKYGYPLDIEYAIEESKIWVMQVRPVATFLSAYRETLDNFPLEYNILQQEQSLEQP